MTQDIRKWISQRVRALRARKKLTQQQLSEAAQVDYKSIQRLEGKNAQLFPKIHTLEKVSKALGLTLSDFFKGR